MLIWCWPRDFSAFLPASSCCRVALLAEAIKSPSSPRLNGAAPGGGGRRTQQRAVRRESQQRGAYQIVPCWARCLAISCVQPSAIRSNDCPGRTALPRARCTAVARAGRVPRAMDDRRASDRASWDSRNAWACFLGGLLWNGAADSSARYVPSRTRPLDRGQTARNTRVPFLDGLVWNGAADGSA